MITIRGLRWFSLAMTSSLMIANTFGDQPRISVWPLSITRERPLRISSMLDFHAGGDRADERADDEDAAQRDEQRDDPQRPAGVVGHVAGVERPHQQVPGRFDEAGPFLSPRHRTRCRRIATTTAASSTIASDTTASQPMMAIGPAERVFSKW